MPQYSFDPLAIAYLAQFPREAAQILVRADARTIADLLGSSIPPLQVEQVGVILSALPLQTGADSLALLPDDIAAAVLATLSVAEIAEIITPMSAVTTRRLLSSLRPVDVAAVRRTQSYAPDSVGKRMQTQTTVLPEGISISAARSMLPTGRADAPAVVFILDSRRHIRGIVPLHDITTANDTTDVDTLLRPAPPSIKANQRLKEVQKLALWHEHRYLPVVGMQNRFVGVLERSDVFDALHEMDSLAPDKETDPIGVLLAVAETLWVPLAQLFGSAATPLHPHLRREGRINDESS